MERPEKLISSDQKEEKMKEWERGKEKVRENEKENNDE